MLTLNKSDSDILRVDRCVWLVHIDQITEERFGTIRRSGHVDTCKSSRVQEASGAKNYLVIFWGLPHTCGPLDRGPGVRGGAVDLRRTLSSED